MRIGIDTRLTHYRREGGIAQYTLRLLGALLQLGGPDRCIALHHYRDRPSALLDGNGASQRAASSRARGDVEVSETSASQRAASSRALRGHPLFTPPHHRREQWTLPFELLAARLDVLHSPDFIPPFHRRCPAVITVHDLAFKLYPQHLTADSAAYYGQIERAVASAEQIIAVSEATRQDMLHLLPVDAQKITVIYEAADPLYRPRDDSDQVQQVLRTYGLEGPFVLAVGTIEPRKNLLMLLRAFRGLLNRDPACATLVIAGPRGWLADDVAALHAKLALADQVRFLGAVPASELSALYTAAELFVMPSLYEGFGLPVVEAMACGTPVIVSNVSSLPEVAGDAGLCLPPDDVDGWAEAMRQVLNDPTRRAAMRQQSLRQARRFSWERAAQETLAVYHKAAA